MDKNLPNGGFPPIKLCIKKDKKENIEFTKERLTKPNITKNINIKKIFNTNTQKPLINISNDNDEIEIIEEV